MEEQAGAQGGSFLQARCDKVLVTNDWCLPLVLALLLLLLIYTFLYLPSLAHHNNTLWNLMDKDLEPNCGCKHLIADTPSPNRIIRLDCSFLETVVDWTDCGCVIVIAWFLEAMSRERLAEKKSGKDEENWIHSFQISLFLEPKDILNLEPISALMWDFCLWIFSVLWEYMNALTPIFSVIFLPNWDLRCEYD